MGPRVHLRHSQQWRSQKVGGGTLEQRPWHCTLCHVAQDMTRSWFLSCRERGLGLAKRPQTTLQAVEGPKIGLPCPQISHLHIVCHTTRFGPSGLKKQKGVCHFAWSFWADFGPVWPILSSQRPMWPILNRKVVTGQSLHGVWNPILWWV